MVKKKKTIATHKSKREIKKNVRDRILFPWEYFGFVRTNTMLSNGNSLSGEFEIIRIFHVSRAGQHVAEENRSDESPQQIPALNYEWYIERAPSGPDIIIRSKRTQELIVFIFKRNRIPRYVNRHTTERFIVSTKGSGPRQMIYNNNNSDNACRACTVVIIMLLQYSAHVDRGVMSNI